jgi:hypothetical protein
VHENAGIAESKMFILMDMIRKIGIQGRSREAITFLLYVQQSEKMRNKIYAQSRTLCEFLAINQ